MSQMARNEIATRRATPPIVPPAIAPVLWLDFVVEGVEVGRGVDEEAAVDEGGVDDEAVEGWSDNDDDSDGVKGV